MRNPCTKFLCLYPRWPYLHLTFGILILKVVLEGWRWTQQDVSFDCVLKHIKSPVAKYRMPCNCAVWITAVSSNPKCWHSIFWRFLSQFSSTTYLQMKPSFISMYPAFLLDNLILGTKTWIVKILNKYTQFILSSALGISFRTKPYYNLFQFKRTIILLSLSSFFVLHYLKYISQDLCFTPFISNKELDIILFSAKKLLIECAWGWYQRELGWLVLFFQAGKSTIIRNIVDIFCKINWVKLWSCKLSNVTDKKIIMCLISPK